SYEAGTQNWTENMMEEFNSRRGYDILPWLPVLTGKIVDNSEASDRFLWDFRKTISELMSENYYDQLAGILKERGLKLYAESHEGHRTYIADGMEVKRLATIPMSAIWVPKGPAGSIAITDNEEIQESQTVARGNAATHIADIRESASVAHIYGQNLVAAESLTALGTKTHFDWEPNGSAWIWSPETLKPTADLALANGLNRFVIHSSVHQPLDDNKPGLTLSRYGQWFNRHETWAEKAKPWINYLTRSSFMLQQGKFVADIVYFYGEDNNITGLFGNQLPDIPEGYNYDFVNADALINLLSFVDGKIITPSGMSYHLLALDPNSQYMSLPVLQKIYELVNAGAVVVGSKPISTPSLSDNQDEFKTLVDKLWGKEKDKQKVKKGTIYSGHTLTEVMDDMNLRPDFSYTKPNKNTELLFVHRKTKDADIYWINNRNDQPENLETIFRIKNKKAEIWHPVSGKIEKASYKISNGFTRVPLRLDPHDALFVVFRKNTNQQSEIFPNPVETTLDIVDGQWNVSFQKEWGAPEQITIEKLISWSDYDDPGVKYYSGTGSYTKTIIVPENWVDENQQLWIDLGNVKNLAEVIVNGKSAGIVWKKPFRVNLTDFLDKGENTLEINVTNLWVNRLIGDQQPDATKKYTYIATKPLQKADFPLLKSGLLGPVKIIGVN
ncbi:MAG: glycosyl hydrolase, partial [Mariniphaga sp.]|nr:glycosyl hydrolase [Mariniphaga sp.]